MKITSSWLTCILAIVIPILGFLVMLHTDMQTLRETKADCKEVSELKLDISLQLVRNTTAIENLNSLLRDIKGDTYVKQECSNRGRDREATRADNQVPQHESRTDATGS